MSGESSQVMKAVAISGTMPRHMPGGMNEQEPSQPLQVRWQGERMLEGLNHRVRDSPSLLERSLFEECPQKSLQGKPCEAGCLTQWLRNKRPFSLGVCRCEGPRS
jgi:hypothetical protein